MANTESTAVMTNMGFDWGDMAVERCFEHKGYRCVRIRSMATGSYVDIQLSPRGRKISIERPIRAKLKGYDPCGGKQTFKQVFQPVSGPTPFPERGENERTCTRTKRKAEETMFTR